MEFDCIYLHKLNKKQQYLVIFPWMKHHQVGQKKWIVFIFKGWWNKEQKSN